MANNYNESNNYKKNNGSSLESQELSAEDYAIIAAGLSALGEVFAFISLVKAKEILEETGGQSGIIPAAAFVQSIKKKAKRKSRPRRP